jgi:hypothetical protein
MRAAKILGFFVVVVAETFLYLPTTRAFRSLLGRQGDVGSQFLGFWLFVVLPGAVALIASTATYLLTSREALEGSNDVLTGAWVANLLLLCGSAIWYSVRWS